MKYRSIAAIILGIITSGCSALVSKVFPLDDLPEPPGPHKVGTRFLNGSIQRAGNLLQITLMTNAD